MLEEGIVREQRNGGEKKEQFEEKNETMRRIRRRQNKVWRISRERGKEDDE